MSLNTSPRWESCAVWIDDYSRHYRVGDPVGEVEVPGYDHE
ncbi:MAG: hypothetical protein QXQ96_04015 [Sulfolobales archaeon]